jgi:hypothetical protein
MGTELNEAEMTRADGAAALIERYLAIVENDDYEGFGELLTDDCTFTLMPISRTWSGRDDVMSAVMAAGSSRTHDSRSKVNITNWLPTANILSSNTTWRTRRRSSSQGDHITIGPLAVDPGGIASAIAGGTLGKESVDSCVDTYWRQAVREWDWRGAAPNHYMAHLAIRKISSRRALISPAPATGVRLRAGRGRSALPSEHAHLADVRLLIGRRTRLVPIPL